MNNYDENKESSFSCYLDANNLYGYPVTKKLTVGSFKWVKNVSRIDEEFIKNHDENSDIGYFIKVDLEYPKELLICIVTGLCVLTSLCVRHMTKKYVAHIKNIKQA